MGGGGQITCILDSEHGPIPMDIFGHSRYSFRVRLPENGGVREFDGRAIKIAINEHEFELGRCRVFPILGSFPPEGRIVFTDEQVDVADLMDRQRLTVSDTGLFNLQLILTQKDRVSQRFKEFSANLTFELSVYRQFFDELDRQYAKELPEVREHLRQMIIEKEGREFNEFFGRKVEELKQVTCDLSPEENAAHGFFFRKQVWDFILQSEFMMRTNLKPRSYAGDFEMMRMVYANQYIGKSIFSRLMHRYPLQTPAAQAVRNRRNVIGGFIRRLLDLPSISALQPARVMSVACGPAAEILDVFRDSSDAFSISLTLLDQDGEALCAAAANARTVESRLGRPINVKYVNDSVRSLMRIRDLPAQYGRFDLIYSMGLFDYLTPPVARVVLERLCKMLNPGGQIVVGNFHSDNPDRVFMEYWLDWVLFYRTEREMLDLSRSITAGYRRVFYEDTRCQMFLEIADCV